MLVPACKLPHTIRITMFVSYGLNGVICLRALLKLIEWLNCENIAQDYIVSGRRHVHINGSAQLCSLLMIDTRNKEMAQAIQIDSEI